MGCRRPYIKFAPVYKAAKCCQSSQQIKRSPSQVQSRGKVQCPERGQSVSQSQSQFQCPYGGQSKYQFQNGQGQQSQVQSRCQSQCQVMGSHQSQYQMPCSYGGQVQYPNAGGLSGQSQCQLQTKIGNAGLQGQKSKSGLMAERTDMPILLPATADPNIVR